MNKYFEKFLRSHPKICKFVFGSICPRCNVSTMNEFDYKYEKCMQCGYKIRK